MGNALVSGYIEREGEPSDAEVDPTDGEGEEPSTITLELPCPKEHQNTLNALLQSKATLIQAALGNDCAWGQEFGIDGYLCDLPIEFEGDTAKFEWLTFNTDSDTIKAWSEFLCAAVKFAKQAKRVTAVDKPSANERFDFRVFCVKIGLNGTEYKATRKTLSRFLSGYAAFSTPASKEKWLAKHGTKKIEEAGSDE
jgi:hypothetical protein